MKEKAPLGVFTPNQIPLTTIVTYLQNCYRSRISNRGVNLYGLSVSYRCLQQRGRKLIICVTTSCVLLAIVYGCVTAGSYAKIVLRNGVDKL